MTIVIVGLQMNKTSLPTETCKVRTFYPCECGAGMSDTDASSSSSPDDDDEVNTPTTPKQRNFCSFCGEPLQRVYKVKKLDNPFDFQGKTVYSSYEVITLYQLVNDDVRKPVADFVIMESYVRNDGEFLQLDLYSESYTKKVKRFKTHMKQLGLWNQKNFGVFVF